MNYLIDTNTLTALANRNPAVVSKLAALPSGSVVASCFVVTGEWEYGIRNASTLGREEAIRAAGEPILAALDAIWHSTPDVCLEYGSLQAQLRASGRQIPVNDAWIAAVALVNDAVVVTTDPHFGHVNGLRVDNWTT